jgi:hypothetical protein
MAVRGSNRPPPDRKGITRIVMAPGSRLIIAYRFEK